MKHLGTVTLETDRLILRQFKPEDIPLAYKNWTSDTKIVPYLTWPVHDSVEVTEEIISEWIKNYKNPSFYQWSIVLKEIGEPIGSISVVDQSDDESMVHIGYCLGSPWWNQGLMTEALREVLRFFFEDVGIKRLESEYDTRNPGSGRVMEKAGLIYDREFKGKEISNLGPGTSRLMSMNDKQWNQRSV